MLCHLLGHSFLNIIPKLLFISNFRKRHPSMGDPPGVMSTVFKRIPIGGSAAVFKVGLAPF